MDLRDYFRLFFRWWWALLLGLVAGLGIGYLALSFLGALSAYSATVTILAADAESASSGRSSTLILTCAELAQQDTVTEAVVDALGLSISAQDVAEATEVRVVADTQLLEITFTDKDPHIAAAVANELARQLANHQWVREYRLQVVSAAAVPGSPNLDPYINILLAGAMGLFLVAGLVFLGEYLGDAVRGSSALAAHLALPVLGTLTRKADRSPQAIWPLVELCARLDKAGHRRLLITSPGRGEGKSTLAVLLATAWTRSGRTALLVDAHAQRPVLHQRLDCSNDAGLADWLASPEQAIPARPLSERLALLPIGSSSGERPALLASQQWPTALAALDQQADLVIIDAPPVLPTAEVALLAPQMDGVLLVLRAGRTKHSAASEALEALKLVDSPVLGLVLNQG